MAPDRRGCFLQFAKAPRAGGVKSRLIPALGAAGAAAVAERLIVEVAGALGCVPAGWSASLWADDPGDPLLRKIAADHGRVLHAQGDGGLGERMRRAALEGLRRHAAIVLVGSDCLGYDPGYLRQATAALEAGSDAVLGPAVDGGYVLLGLRTWREGLFDGITWGGPVVAQQQRERLAQLGMSRAELPPRADVDRAADLWMLRAGPVA